MKDLAIVTLKMAGLDDDLETRMLISSKMFYYGSLFCFLVIVTHVYTNGLYIVALFRAKKKPDAETNLKA